MRIIYEWQFRKSLQSIVKYIAKDNSSASKIFKKDLKDKFELLIDNPYMYRASLYFKNDDSYRDMIYMGYTVIYKVDNNEIKVLDIFKWEDKF